MRNPGAETVKREEGSPAGGSDVGGSLEGVRGVVRTEWNLLLVRCGVAYGLMDPECALYLYGLRSEVYRLSDYIGEYVEVFGPVVREDCEPPVVQVMRLQVLRQRWMG